MPPNPLWKWDKDGRAGEKKGKINWFWLLEFIHLNKGCLSKQSP